MMEVFQEINSSREFCISTSVLLSSAEVASSSMSISGFFKKILAMLSLCFSQPESFNHLSPISVCIPSFCFKTKSAFAFLRASIISSSVASALANKRLFFIVVLNKLLSCITIQICFLKDFLVIFFVSIPSKYMYPFFISQNLKSSEVIVDFQLPVLPTSAIFSQGFILKFISFRTSFSSSFLYEKFTFLNSIFQEIFSISAAHFISSS